METDPQEFLAAFLPGELRVLTRTGVEIHCLQYWSDALEPWVGQHCKVMTHYDPRDITYVVVRSPGGVLIRSTLTTPGIPTISLAEWQARREQERVLSKDPALLAERDASLLRNDKLIEVAKATRRVKRRRATAAAGDAFLAESSPTVHTNTELTISDETDESEITITNIYEVDSYEQF